MGITLPKAHYKDRVLTKHNKRRDVTKEEQEIISWCYRKDITPTVAKISNVTLTEEPFREEWLEEVKPLYLESIKQYK